MIPVILSGGSGSRLWPLSRPLYPKQFLALHSEKTLFQETAERLRAAGLDDPIIICNEEHRFIVAENLRSEEMTSSRIILEPVGRNTAPAIALAALSAIEKDPEAIICVMPADHVIKDQAAFEGALEKAGKLAASGYLVTFGVTPTQAHTGYGYIQTGDKISGGGFSIKAFKEKPDEKTAQSFIKDGNHLWNGGMFVFKASVFLTELEKFEPEMITSAKKALELGAEDLDFFRLDKSAFTACKDISIDYAVMEKTDKGAVVPLDAQWQDVGSWSSLWEILEKDESGNVGKGDVLLKDSADNYVYSENKLVAALGVKDLVIIDTKDALLVADKAHTQDVKKIVEDLKQQKRKEALHHRTVYRPWGHYDSIDFGERDQVKRITVNPGQKLSIQMHHHRAEHWVVVKGTARVTKGEEQVLVTENQSIYLPLGVVHALENPGKIPLELIEVQTGSYLGEDDIVRFEDRYGRAQ